MKKINFTLNSYITKDILINSNNKLNKNKKCQKVNKIYKNLSKIIFNH